MTKNLNSALEETLEGVLDAATHNDQYVIGEVDLKPFVTTLTKLIDQERVEAEQIMGEAIIARMRQSNYQWEKAESFIQSYQLQKAEDTHGVFKALKQSEGSSNE